MGLRDAPARADALLARQAGHEEATAARAAAYRLAARGAPSPEDVETLGGGWVGEEALAIAVCCALAAEDFADGVLRAVTHSGDSDSTGVICGNSLGALWGEAAIPARWLAELELREEIGRVAEDLCAAEVATLGGRYPGSKCVGPTYGPLAIALDFCVNVPVTRSGDSAGSAPLSDRGRGCRARPVGRLEAFAWGRVLE